MTLCKALCDENFIKIEGNGLKFSTEICALASTVIFSNCANCTVCRGAGAAQGFNSGYTPLDKLPNFVKNSNIFKIKFSILHVCMTYKCYICTSLMRTIKLLLFLQHKNYWCIELQMPLYIISLCIQFKWIKIFLA